MSQSLKIPPHLVHTHPDVCLEAPDRYTVVERGPVSLLTIRRALSASRGFLTSLLCPLCCPTIDGRLGHSTAPDLGEGLGQLNAIREQKEGAFPAEKQGALSKTLRMPGEHGQRWGAHAGRTMKQLGLVTRAPGPPRPEGLRWGALGAPARRLWSQLSPRNCSLHAPSQGARDPSDAIPSCSLRGLLPRSRRVESAGGDEGSAGAESALHSAKAPVAHPPPSVS